MYLILLIKIYFTLMIEHTYKKRRMKIELKNKFIRKTKFYFILIYTLGRNFKEIFIFLPRLAIHSFSIQKIEIFWFKMKNDENRLKREKNRLIFFSVQFSMFRAIHKSPKFFFRPAEISKRRFFYK